MHKEYTIEVPLYSRPVKDLAKINSSEDISIIVYGGIPNSPLNGGRMNFALDGLFLWNSFFHLRSSQLERVTAKFYETVSEINRHGMSFCVTCTNIFVSEKELNEANLYPIQWLVESSQKHGIKNGVILNNALLEEHLRRKYGDKLIYISSCTKYALPHKMLAPSDTISMYKEDCDKYDFVVLTPQDSRREQAIKKMASEHKNRIIAIANSYCSNGCNTYYHYAYTSRQNKISLLRVLPDRDVIVALIKFLPCLLKCSVFWHVFFPVEVEKIATRQLNAGIVNFKLGRGFGVEKLEKLVILILKFKRLSMETAVF